MKEIEQVIDKHGGWPLNWRAMGDLFDNVKQPIATNSASPSAGTRTATPPSSRPWSTPKRISRTPLASHAVELPPGRLRSATRKQACASRRWITFSGPCSDSTSHRFTPPPPRSPGRTAISMLYGTRLPRFTTSTLARHTAHSSPKPIP